MNNIAVVRFCIQHLEKWKIGKFEMLNKTCEYIAVFKKEDGKVWKENPSESNNSSEWVFWKEYIAAVFRDFLKLSLKALFQLRIGCISGLWINLTAKILDYSPRYVIYYDSSHLKRNLRTSVASATHHETLALKSCKWSNIPLLFLFFFSFKSVIQFCAVVLQETTDSRRCLRALAEGRAPSGKAPCPGAGCGLRPRLLPCWARRPPRARASSPCSGAFEVCLSSGTFSILSTRMVSGASAGRGRAADWVMRLCWERCRGSASLFPSGFKHFLFFDPNS